MAPVTCSLRVMASRLRRRPDLLPALERCGEWLQQSTWCRLCAPKGPMEQQLLCSVTAVAVHPFRLRHAHDALQHIPSSPRCTTNKHRAEGSPPPPPPHTTQFMCVAVWATHIRHYSSTHRGSTAVQSPTSCSSAPCH